MNKSLILLIVIVAFVMGMSLQAPTSWYSGYKVYGKWWDLMGEVAIRNGSVNNISCNQTNCTGFVNLTVNNTNMGTVSEGGTGERISTVLYWSNDSPTQVIISAHANSVSETADIAFNISNVTVARSSGRPLGGAEESWKSIVIIVPQGENYSANITNYHHYTWTEYKIK